jgi:hypothetical protein
MRDGDHEVTLMSATSFNDAKQRNRIAQDMLNERDRQKARAATQDPEANDQRYRSKAEGRSWPGPNPFDQRSRRTT